MFEIIAYCFLFGAIAGLLAGLFGIGGGVVLVPLLLWLFSVQGFAEKSIMIMAVATSLASMIITSIAAVAAHQKLRSIIWNTVYLLVPAIFPGAVLGAYVADYLPAQILKVIFAIYLLVVASQMAWPLDVKIASLAQSRRLFSIAGITIGAFSAILGIGGGSLTVPLLIRYQYTMRTAVAISSACSLPIAITGSISYIFLGWSQTNLPAYSLGYIYVPAFVAIVSMSTITAPIGAGLTQKLPTKILQSCFSVLLFFVAGKLLFF